MSNISNSMIVNGIMALKVYNIMLSRALKDLMIFNAVINLTNAKKVIKMHDHSYWFQQ